MELRPADVALREGSDKGTGVITPRYISSPLQRWQGVRVGEVEASAVTQPAKQTIGGVAMNRRESDVGHFLPERRIWEEPLETTRQQSKPRQPALFALFEQQLHAKADAE